MVEDLVGIHGCGLGRLHHQVARVRVEAQCRGIESLMVARAVPVDLGRLGQVDEMVGQHA